MSSSARFSLLLQVHRAVTSGPLPHSSPPFALSVPAIKATWPQLSASPLRMVTQKIFTSVPSGPLVHTVTGTPFFPAKRYWSYGPRAHSPAEGNVPVIHRGITVTLLSKMAFFAGTALQSAHRPLLHHLLPLTLKPQTSSANGQGTLSAHAAS